jgi:hypothetical protein
MTANTKRTSGVVSLFIGLAVLLFVLLLALWVLKIFFAVAPLIGIAMAAYGGWRYYQAGTDGEKLSAMSLVAGGLGIAVLGFIF